MAFAYTIDVNSDGSTTATDFTIQPGVPEPNSLVFLGTGGMLLLGRFFPRRLWGHDSQA
jgi:hypothetical protein